MLILCHKHFAVLIGIHGTGVYVQIGIKLLNRNPITPRLQDGPVERQRCPFPAMKRRRPWTKIYFVDSVLLQVCSQ